MAKATDTQIKKAQEQLANGETPTDKLRINFGDAEPIQKAGSDEKPAETDGKK